MESGAKNPLEPVQEIYDQVLDPEKSIELLAELEKVKAVGPTEAERSAYEAIVRLCEYLNKWNGVDKTVLIEAEEEIKSALKINANLAIAHYAMGFVHRAYGRHPEALESFTKAIEINDDYPRAHAQRGSELLYLGRPDEALPEVQKAIDLKPDSPTVGMYQWTLGRIWFFKNDYEKSIAHLQKSVACWQELWYNRLYLVSAYAHKGDHESAKRELEAFTSKFGPYSVAKVQDNEKTNPNKDPFVVVGRRRFHEGLVKAGMPLGPLPRSPAGGEPTERSNPAKTL